MTKYAALKHSHIQMLNKLKGFGANDVLVIFGELFSRGYVNGLLQAAQARKMKIIYSTVGRRDKDNGLRVFSSQELADLPKPLINIPLEAGFDLEPDDQGRKFIDHLKDVKLTNWEDFQFPDGSVDQSRQRGRDRFQKNLRAYLTELRKEIPAESNILFAHIMAGGVPRTKIVMPLMNRIVKGTGERYLSSEKFINTAIGKAVMESFNEVTAETFQFLIQESSDLRKDFESRGKKVSYLAYGYHGSEVLTGREYVWQSYTPYIQGWAKIRLENYADEAFRRGILTCVYNCPEILTNSSSIFSGVEVSLYPLLGALAKEGPGKAQVSELIASCAKLLKPGVTVDSMLELTKNYLTSELIREHCVFARWPQHSSPAQLEKMLASSDELIDLHQDSKELITYKLSEMVIEACGELMIINSFKPENSVEWINHDVISQWFSQS